MNIELEKEIKYLITYKDFQNLINNDKNMVDLFNEHKIKEIQNHISIDIYFDDMKRNIKKLNAILRIRIIDNEHILTFKQKDELGHSVEKSIKITKEQKNNFIKLYPDIIKPFELDVSTLFEIAKYKVHRKSFIFDDFRIDIDNTKFINNEDYELEIEDVSLAQAEKKLKEIQEKFNLTLKPSKPKIARFFEGSENEENLKLDIKDIIVVVEGKSDTSKLKSVFSNINTFETSGLGLTKEMVEELKKISQENNKKVVVLTDPDTAGEIIRNTIKKEMPDAYHIHIPKSKAKNSKKVGIEHCKKEDLMNIFNNIKQYNEQNQIYKIEDLINLGIYQNKEKRKQFCDKYGISYGNNKKVLKQLNNYNIKL